MTAKVLGADEVTMKKQLLDAPKHDKHGREWHRIVRDEIYENSEQIIRDGGLFLSFVSDPLLPETFQATLFVIRSCFSIFPSHPIPVTILTKSAWWLDPMDVRGMSIRDCLRNPTDDDPLLSKVKANPNLSLGFTLTGMDEMERHCISSTQERIEAMAWAHNNGIYTWASIEPVIDFDRAIAVIYKSMPYCKEYRIGLASKLGIKYSKADVESFLKKVKILNWNNTHKIILKKSVLDKIK